MATDRRKPPSRPPGTRRAPAPAVGRAPAARSKPAAKPATKPAAKRAAKPAATRSAAKPAAARATAAKRPAARKPAAKKPAATRSSAKRGTPAATTRRPAATAADRSGRRALGRVDGVRGQRDGVESGRRRQRNRRRRRLASGVAGTVVFVGVLFVAVFPAQTWRAQRAATAQAEAQLQDIEARRDRVAREDAKLDTDEEVERLARELFGFRYPDEESYNVLPGPTDPIGLPDTWPFTGVERELGAG